MRKLLIIGPTPPPIHGVAQAIDALLKSKLNEKFSLIHLDLADRRGIEFVNQPDFHDLILFLKQWFKLIALGFKHRPALTYLTISQTTIGFTRDSFFILVSLLWNSKIILHLHSGNFRNWYDHSGTFTRTYVRFILNRIDQMIVLGHSLKPIFEGLVPSEKVSVVPNGLPWINETRPAESLLKKNGKIRILHLSTLTRLKGAMVLLNSIPLVIKEFNNVEFVFAGNWYRKEEREEAASIIARENITEFTVFTGEVNGLQKKELFESADLFVFPGVQQEGQPLVVIEAMASRLPVIFTNRGCLRETVFHGVTGLETEINNTQDLADKMIWMLRHPDERKKMAIKGRERYENNYTNAHFEKNMIAVFEKTFEEKKEAIQRSGQKQLF
jgi:glycosyltransferase involved in cell wall biosynthesis